MTTNNNLLPPIGLYSDLLYKASRKFNIGLNEVRSRYGRFTIKQWSELLGADPTIFNRASS
jgi:hypothetical protein